MGSYETYFRKNNIEHEEFEETQSKEVMNKEGIQGYPTIRATINNKTSDYNGPRDVESVLNYLGIQLGGGNTIIKMVSYYNTLNIKKYLELKVKYSFLEEGRRIYRGLH